MGGARPRWGGLGGVGPGKGHGTAERQRLDPPHRRLDRRRPIDGDRDHGQVLGEAEQPVGAQRMASAEALDPSQEGARLQVLLGERIEHSVGDEGGRRAVAFAERDAELEQLAAQSNPPSSSPTHAIATPTTRLIARLALATPGSPSSASRSDSNIQVLKVV